MKSFIEGLEELKAIKDAYIIDEDIGKSAKKLLGNEDKHMVKLMLI